MLQVALAGLVMQGVMTESEAEKIMDKLKKKPIPKTVKEVLAEIEEVIYGQPRSHS